MITDNQNTPLAFSLNSHDKIQLSKFPKYTLPLKYPNRIIIELNICEFFIFLNLTDYHPLSDGF